MTQKHIFDASGTRYYVLTSHIPDSKRLNGVLIVLLALPDFYWCLEVSGPPSADVLRSKKACNGNRLDCAIFADWLAENWPKITRGEP